MSWTGLKIAPGIVRSSTRYATAGTWFDGSLVRFREGYPEKWEGWQDAYPGFVMIGRVRSLHRHSILTGASYISAGSSKRFYMITDDAQADVTPFDGSTPTPVAMPNSLSTTNGSNLVRVAHTEHGKFPGDSVVIAGATDIGGIPAASLNMIHEVENFVSEDVYEIKVNTIATSTVSGGGGASVTIQYILHAGTDDFISGGGWGALTWTEEEWGGDLEDIEAGLADQAGLWSQDNWGEDLVACAMNGGIYFWDATTPLARMKNILDLPGADLNAPADAQFIIVSHRDRHLLAFGASVLCGRRLGRADVVPLVQSGEHLQLERGRHSRDGWLAAAVERFQVHRRDRDRQRNSGMDRSGALLDPVHRSSL